MFCVKFVHFPFCFNQKSLTREGEIVQFTSPKLVLVLAMRRWCESEQTKTLRGNETKKFHDDEEEKAQNEKIEVVKV